MTKFPSVLEDRFEPVRLLGEGGFGSVWLAEQKALHRQVALKMLHAQLADTEEQVGRFRDEARLTAQIRHEGVVTLLDHGVDAGVPWMAFEYVEGHSLREWADRGRTPWRQVFEMAAQVGAALDLARQKGIVHRDIKPDNILVGNDGRFKIADFGIAKWAGNQTKTADGMVLGTPAYVSPMQIKGHLPAHHSDLYALGCTMYELLGGHPPFQDDNPILLLERHLTKHPPPLRGELPDLPEAVERVVLKLLAKERDQRYDTAAELVEAVNTLLGKKTPAQAPAGEVAPPVGSGVRSRAPSITRPVSRAGVAAPVQVHTPVRVWMALAIGAALALVALVAIVAHARTPQEIAPSATVAAPTSPISTRDQDLTELAPELIRVSAAADALRNGRPTELEVIDGLLRPDTERRAKQLPDLLEAYAKLLRTALEYRGPHPERTLMVAPVAFEVLDAAGIVMAQMLLDGQSASLPPVREPRIEPALGAIRALAHVRPVDAYRNTLRGIIEPFIDNLGHGKAPLLREMAGIQLQGASSGLQHLFQAEAPPGSAWTLVSLMLMMDAERHIWGTLKSKGHGSKVEIPRYVRPYDEVRRAMASHGENLLAIVAQKPPPPFLENALVYAFWCCAEWSVREESAEQQLRDRRAANAIFAMRGREWMSKGFETEIINYARSWLSRKPAALEAPEFQPLRELLVAKPGSH